MTQLGKTSLLDQTTTPAQASSRSGSARTMDWRKLGMIALAVVSVAVMAFIVFRSFNRYQNSPNAQSRYRTLVDSETGEAFVDFRIPTGSSFPLKNPKTGKATLFIGEPCYWTKEGKAKLNPTWVLVKETIGQPGPTLCPDCGRKVVAHNPTPPDAMLIEAAQKQGK